MGKQATSTARTTDIDFPKLRPFDILDTVKPSESFVEERVICVQKFEHAAVRADDFFEKSLGLTSH